MIYAELVGCVCEYQVLSSSERQVIMLGHSGCE